jgi:Ni/Co efflux regulator RcnB
MANWSEIKGKSLQLFMWRQNMLKTTKQINRILALSLAGLLATSSTALAEKPSWAGDQGKGGKHEQQDKHQSHEGGDDGYSGQHHGDDGKTSVYFNDNHRNVVHDYYAEQYRSGKCPPGLAKKHNGCMPPGQARKWQIGRPLPRDVIFYDLPQSVLIRLGPPPAHQRFVRVASDILLIAVGTGMVIDAIQDLSEL